MKYDHKWIQWKQEGYQNIVDDVGLQKWIADRYSWDTSSLEVGVFVPGSTPGNHHVSLTQNEMTLLKFEIQDLSFLEEDQNFLAFLQTLDGDIVNVIPIVRIKKIEVTKESSVLNKSAALAYLLSSLLESVELAVIEESEFKSQPDAFQDFLTTFYCIKGDRITEYDGKTYLKCFSASSWLA